MSFGVHLEVEPEAIDASDVEDFVNAHLTQTARLDRPLSDTAYKALFHYSHGDRRLLLTLGSLAVFLAGLESASQVESRHVDAAALSRSEVELTDGVTSTITADAGAKFLISKFGQGMRRRRRRYAGVAAAMLACLAIGLSYALSPSRPALPGLDGPLQGIAVTTMAPASVAPDPPALASADPPPPPVSPPPVSPPNAAETPVANLQSPADTPTDGRTAPSQDSGTAPGIVVAMANNARDAPPLLSRVLVTFVTGDAAARERASRLARYLRDHGYDAEAGPLLEGGRHTGHVEYFFGADSSAATQLAALLGGGPGAAMLTPTRLDQRRPGTLEIAVPSSKAVSNFKGASPMTDPFELWHVGKNR